MRCLSFRRRRANASAVGVLLLSLLVGCSSLSTKPASVGLRVMSFNVRLAVDSDGRNRWDARRDLAAPVIRAADPDVIGTQELFQRQGDDLVARLPEYAWFGKGRRGDAEGAGDEHMGVFFRTDRLRVLESGDFWLSDTPAVPGSITWGHPYPRMVTWALFQRIADGRRFYLFDTHLPYREQDEDARLRGMRLLMSRIAALPADVPVIVTGDFNTVPESAVHASAMWQLRDTWIEARTRTGPERTFHNFTGKPDRRIDWILVRGLRADAFHTINTNAGGRYPSDHFPVMAELRFDP